MRESNLKMTVTMLQVSWEVTQLEGTKLNGEGVAPEVGVYVGIQQMEYGGMAAPYLSKIGPFSATGGPFSVAAGRMSFIYGLKGPAVRRALLKEYASVDSYHQSIIRYGCMTAVAA